MPDTRGGFHGDIAYVFEDAGFDTAPNDTTFKAFGGNATMDTFEGARQAQREYNASRRAAEIIRNNFDGGWGVSFDLGATPPWWLAAAYGQPSTTGVDTDSDGTNEQYEHLYSLDNGNDPVPLRLYAPTDGYSNYYVVPGCWLVSATLDQSEDGTAEVSLTGGFARDPFEDNTLSPAAPNFSQTTFENRDAEARVDGTTVGRSQSTSLSLETGTEGKSEIGTDQMVDFTPGAFEPSLSYDKIRWLGEAVDMHQRFVNATEVSNVLRWDNGQTGAAKYVVEATTLGSYPDSWSETGRNDPDADLIEELQDMARDAEVLVVSDDATPPGVA